MAATKNHDYHILPPDIWPMIGSLSALALTSGLVLFMHEMPYGHLVMGLGIAGLIATFYSWFSNIIREGQEGYHTPVVQLHLRYGMILFIASEVMFFVGWFWAWFDFALFPNATPELAEVIGGVFPPVAIKSVIDPFDLPLLNTMILLCSGTTLTWAHHCLIHGDRDGLKKGLWLTVILGVTFTMIQAYEYMHAPFPFGENTYGSAFYMATGFHGFHVIVGTIMLVVCLIRAYKGQFTPKEHFGFEAAAWYWHFVDVVWLFLFVVVYIWGSWGAPIH
ncbi:MAG: cytochrome c oxidase subunit 3 [Sphingomonadaceae bacterium]